ncbi:ORF6N domain-containing protein [Thermodesulfobacteriota bacterium]
MNDLLPVEAIVDKIIILRKEKVLLDRDLAKLYGVSTKVLNQAVSRNRKRFPSDFMFRIVKVEKDELVTNCDRFKTLKHSSVNPRAFTEQGVAMLSSVLNSDRAIQVNIAIMRAFVQLRKITASQAELAKKLKKFESQLEEHDEQFRVVFEAIRALMTEDEKPKRKIGFEISEPKAKYKRKKK